MSMTGGQRALVAVASVSAVAIAAGAVYELTKASAPVVKSLPNPTVQLTETGPVAPVQLGAGGVVNFIAPSGGTFLGGSSTQSVTQAALAADIGHVTLQLWTNADGTMGSVKGTLSGTTLSFGAVTNQPGTGTGGSGGTVTVQIAETGSIVPVQVPAGATVTFVAPSGGTFFSGGPTVSRSQSDIAGGATVLGWTNADGTTGSVTMSLSGTQLSFGTVSNSGGGGSATAVSAALGGPPVTLLVGQFLYVTGDSDNNYMVADTGILQETVGIPGAFLALAPGETAVSASVGVGTEDLDVTVMAA